MCDISNHKPDSNHLMTTLYTCKLSYEHAFINTVVPCLQENAEETNKITGYEDA